jgi:hypothetical protein
MTTYYRATFSDGTVIKRSTASRRYTHAWIYRHELEPELAARWGSPTSQSQGFSGSIVNAYATLGRYQRPGNKVLLAEVAPVFEITAAEYRQKARRL